MSQQFLERLLSTEENHMRSDQGANCMVCYEDYNTLNASTGVVEWEIRLPCGHQLGSSCIVTWLRANNNCPACRAVFFPAQPRPYLDHSIMNPNRPRMARVPTRPVVRADVLTRNFCLAFHDRDFSDIVSVVSRGMARYLMRIFENHTQQEIAATSIYMASHLVGQPKTPTEISRVAGVSPNRIQSVYRQVYPERMQFIGASSLAIIAGDHVEGMLAFLPAPDDGNGVMGEEEERQELQRYHIRLHDLSEQVERILSMNLGGSRSVSVISEDIATRIIGDIHSGGALESISGLRSPRLIVAIGLYMASHLLGLQTSPRRIADLVGIDERTLKWAYGRVYPQRNLLIKSGMLPYIGLENLPRALEALPALNWPPR